MCVFVAQSCPTLCDSMDCSPPGKDTGVGCHFLLQGIFPTQGSNPGLLHCRQILYWLSYKYLRLPWWLRWQSVCLQCGRPRFNLWVGNILWRRKWPPTPVLLPGKSHGWRSVVGYSPWGRKESDTIERLHFTLMAQKVKNLPTMWETWVQFLGWEDLEKGMENQSRILAWRILWTEATVHEVTESSMTEQLTFSLSCLYSWLSVQCQFCSLRRDVGNGRNSLRRCRAGSGNEIHLHCPSHTLLAV